MKQAAGILLYRTGSNGLEVLLVHPGGPFWAKKDAGAWSLPKGEFDPEEDPFSAAKREFKEELGSEVPDGKAIELGQFKVTSSKMLAVWAIEGDLDTKHVKSNMFEMEWPPRSGNKQEFPEADKAEWFSVAAARAKLVKGQVSILDKLADELGVEISDVPPEPTSSTPKKDTKTTEGQTSLF
jgi:predicted NUDIX family NTP pyrophosphohydrolase